MKAPHVIVERDGFRLVHSVRDQNSWKTLHDLVLEREITDAMGAKAWTRCTSWCLGASREWKSYENDHAGASDLALHLLLTDFPVMEKR